MIAVAVGHEELVGLRVIDRIGGLLEILRIGVAFTLRAVADLQDEFAVLGETSDLIVGDGWSPGRARAGQLLPPIQTKPCESM